MHEGLFEIVAVPQKLLKLKKLLKFKYLENQGMSPDTELGQMMSQ